MLSAKEQRATEIIIYELRKWDDESHRRLSVTGINIIAATYKSLEMTALHGVGKRGNTQS